MPKVSVLMPVYRTNPDYLKEAISSILNQSYKDFEFLILDDCPEDSREDIVKSFHDNRIKYLKNGQNLGITPSRNKLIELSKGEYLAVMDHDDLSLPDRFQEQVKFLDEHPDVSVVGSWYQQIPNNSIFKFPETNEEIELALMNDCYILHPSSMIRKSVLTKNNLKYEADFSPSEDFRLWSSLIGKTKFYNIPKVLFKYRVHATNTSKIQSEKMKVCRQRILDESHILHPDLYQKFQSCTRHIVRIKLFGFIPLGKFHQQGNKKNFLFKISPFITWKAKPDVK